LDKPVQSAPAAIANPVLPKQILAKARQCRSEGHLREATRLYHELVENHLGTAEAETAKEMLLELEAEGDCDELLERLLAMAQHCRNEGNLNQAMEMYWELAEDHPGTAEAKKAKSILLDMAANYERDDTPHMARSIYERLLANAEG
jgi:tetratricopeptide (TPR) repeat protein